MFIKRINLTKVCTRYTLRRFSHRYKPFSSNANECSSTHELKKTVFISQSIDVFTNLALEEWLFKNYDFTNQHVLMLWRNSPCVVIGRFQNPWLEASIGNLSTITDNGVQLARRSSGGGTVYHDLGNLNLTFFTSREIHNRKHNLEIIRQAILRQFNVKVEISPKDDLMLRKYKVSGTAARVGRSNAYHHCTLLVNTDKINLSLALQQQIGTDVETNATRSVRSKILNLSEDCPNITLDGLLTAIGMEYLQTPCTNLDDGGRNLASRQDGFQLINPTEEWFPGLLEIRNNLSSWEWCYGNTPEFTMTKSFPVPSQFIELCNKTNNSLIIKMVVDAGRISNVTVTLPWCLTNTDVNGDTKTFTNLKGCKLTEATMHLLETSLRETVLDEVDDKHRFVTECVRRVMVSV